MQPQRLGMEGERPEPVKREQAKAGEVRQRPEVLFAKIARIEDDEPDDDLSEEPS